jgi:putative ATP-dependent endonuclease of OLD family
MQIQSELPLEAADLFRSLKLYVGENGDSAPRGLHEMSLGGANLVYLTLKLLEFEYRAAREAIANFLLIEEPEAHIHTHIQKTLFDRVAYENTQIIYSTHSTQISEVSEIERVNVLSREGNSWVALQPSTGLDPAAVQSAQRYLDAVRSNLLFARSVLLVEGDAEEILIPSLMKEIYGISLDEIGVSLINVRSTGFENVANLFHSIRLRKRCAIITDYDQPYFDITDQDTDRERVQKQKHKAKASAKAGVERKGRLDGYVADNDYVHVEYAPHTFEVDFSDASELNRTILTSVVDKVYERNAERAELKADLAADKIERYGSAALRLATKAGKGWFALLLAGQLRASQPDGDPVLPGYVLRALGFAAVDLPTETWVRILEHRIARWNQSLEASPETVVAGKDLLDRLKQGKIAFENALAELRGSSYVDERLDKLAQAFGK